MTSWAALDVKLSVMQREISSLERECDRLVEKPILAAREGLQLDLIRYRLANDFVDLEVSYPASSAAQVEEMVGLKRRVAALRDCFGDLSARLAR